MRITALGRGGLAVYGGAYDPRTDEASIAVRLGEVVKLVIEYPSTPTEMATAGSGFQATVPDVAGNTATIFLSDALNAQALTISARIEGSTRTITIRPEVIETQVGDGFTPSLDFTDYRNSQVLDQA